MFQFLVGTLKTADYGCPGKEDAGFQFLVGTLKTSLEVAGLPLGNPVSIPRRYAEN